MHNYPLCKTILTRVTTSKWIGNILEQLHDSNLTCLVVQPLCVQAR